MAEGSAGRDVARLAFWAKNMTAIRDGRMEWPGFSYTDEEWARMDALAAAVPGAAYGRYVVVNAVAFIAIAAAVMFGAFLPLATVLFPVPADTSALKFASLLAAFCFLILGVGLQVSLRIATAWATTPSMRAELAPTGRDAALAGKVTWQIDRISLIMCGLLVPGILVWITYDIQAGPIIAALKWLAIALMAVSVAGGLARQARR